MQVLSTEPNEDRIIRREEHVYRRQSSHRDMANPHQSLQLPNPMTSLQNHQLPFIHQSMQNLKIPIPPKSNRSSQRVEIP